MESKRPISPPVRMVFSFGIHIINNSTAEFLSGTRGLFKCVLFFKP